MSDMNIDKLLLSLFMEDDIARGKNSYISELAVITIKSLMPMMDEEAVRISSTRFVEELKLWKYYRTGENPSLLDIQGRVSSDIYWNEKDDSIVSRIIPLVLANKKYEIILDEIIKNLLYTSGNIQALFETISISYLLYLIVNKYDNIIDKLKENIIGLSQVDYLNKYSQYYRFEIKDYPGNFKVSFEREKIQILNTLNAVHHNRYASLEDCINVYNRIKATTFIGKVLYRFLFELNDDFNLPRFYLSLGDYINKLRKSRIDFSQLELKEYILPDIFSFNEGDIFFHSLLREAKVIKKEVKGNHLTSLVQTKTGMYLFKR